MAESEPVAGLIVKATSPVDGSVVPVALQVPPDVASVATVVAGIAVGPDELGVILIVVLATLTEAGLFTVTVAAAEQPATE